MPKTELVDALNTVYGHSNWHNPIRPYFVSGIKFDTAYEAWAKLKPEYRAIVERLIGHTPLPGEGD